MINLLKKAWENKEHIIHGFLNAVKNELGHLPEEQQKVIAERRVICSGCPYNSVNAKKDKTYVSNRLDEHCILCTCNIFAKTACLECNCGIETLNNENIELKWKKIENK